MYTSSGIEQEWSDKTGMPGNSYWGILGLMLLIFAPGIAKGLGGLSAVAILEGSS